MVNYRNISFFEGLNALRFFAAFSVVMHHSETIRKKNGFENLEWLGLFQNGGNAVTFFFVLSGFLITYLLLKESDQTQRISVKTFYLKRVLRIWPLYFLLFFFGTVFLPQILGILNITYEMPYSFGQVWYWFLFFLPGLVTFLYGHHFLEPLWSIGVEEVFYLLWAPIFKIASRHIFPILIAIIVLKIVLMSVCLLLIDDKLFTYLVNIFSFEAMAIGGLGAYFLFNRKSSLSESVLYQRSAQLFIYSLLFIYLVFHKNIGNCFWNIIFETPIFSRLILDFMFLYLILGVSVADNSIIRIKSRFLSFLGEISYGIYMYHMLMIFGIVLVFKKFLFLQEPISGTIFFYVILSFCVISVSALSKLYFEDYFLKLKTGFRIRQ